VINKKESKRRGIDSFTIILILLSESQMLLLVLNFYLLYSIDFIVQAQNTCSPGQYYSTDFNECYRCDKGHYCPNGVKSPCPPGTYNNLYGQVKCRNCSPGDYTEYEGSSFCFRTHKGEYSTDASVLPQQCPPGTYTDQPAQTQCRPCKEGYYNEYSGSTYCVKCPPGRHCPDKTVEPLLCPIGEYNALFQQTKCRKCKTGWFTIATGSLKCTNDTSLLGSIVG
jgi:hypothetical protein